MKRSYFIITGTSRGIGKELARALLDKDDFVFGISRGAPTELAKHNNYSHTHLDLKNIHSIETVIKEIFNQIDLNQRGTICLINNAAMLEPLKTIDRCSLEEINNGLQVSLIAPMALTACFINQSQHSSMKRKVINITSGSGTYPAPSMSVYCAAKAGINMFTQCVGAEQSKHENPIEIIAFDPGMVDTELQKMAREKDEQDFELAGLFKQVHQSGQLQTTEDVVKTLITGYL